jgi:O-antigen/teichoic acid export membrane protein
MSEAPGARLDTTVADRSFRGVLWLLGGAGGKALFQLALLAVLARLITPEEFGIVGAAMIVIGFSALFSQFGVGPALVHQPDLRENHIRVGFWLMMTVSIVAAVVVWMVGPAAAAFLRMPDLEVVVRVLALVFLAQGVGVVAESLLQRELSFKALATVDIVSYVFGYGLIGLVLAALGYGYWALVGGHIGQSLLKSTLVLVLRSHPVMPVIDLRAARELVAFGGGYTLSRFANYAAGQGDNVVVGRVLGAGALGIYGRAYTLLVTPAQLIGSVLDRVLFPAMAAIQHDHGRLGQVYGRGLEVVAILALPASGVILVLAPEIVDVFLGSGWEEVVPLLQIFAVGLLFRTSYKLSDSLVRATGRVYRSAWRQGIYATLVISGASIGGLWGLPGVAVGILIAIACHFVLMAHLAIWITGLPVARFISAHGTGFRLAAVTTAVAFMTTDLLRAVDAPSLVTLIVPLLVLWVLSRNLLVRRWPRFFLGDGGQWMIATADRNLPPWVVRLFRPA